MKELLLQKDNAISVVEIVLIIIVLISLVLIFKNQLTSIVKSIFSRMASDANEI